MDGLEDPFILEKVGDPDVLEDPYFLQVAMGRADAEKQFQEAIEEGREGKYLLIFNPL